MVVVVVVMIICSGFESHGVQKPSERDPLARQTALLSDINCLARCREISAYTQ